jgi:hypothetical protein
MTVYVRMLVRVLVAGGELPQELGIYKILRMRANRLFFL